MATASKPNVEKTVKIRLPLDPINKENDSLFVGVNGKPYQVKRGVAADVPASVAGVIEDSEKAKLKAFDFMRGFETE